MSWLPLHRLLVDAPARPVTATGEDLTALVAQALRVGALVQARGWRRVAVVTEDGWRLAMALFGAWAAGAVVVLPGAVHADAVMRLRDEVDGWFGWHEAVPDALDPTTIDSAPMAAVSLACDRPCLEVWTSGSTGVPKAIPKTLVQLEAELTALEALWGHHLASAVVMGSVSVRHLYGLLFRLLWPLAAGRCLVPEQLNFPEDLIAQSAGQTSVVWVSSPAVLKRLGPGLNWSQARGRVGAVFSSGGVLPAAAGVDVEARLGVRPIEVYGSSETGGVAWRRGEELWQPFPGVTATVAANGCLQVRSPHLPLGESYETADAVEWRDGGFRLLGRQDRIIKLEEKRISLPEVEQVLLAHPWVEEAAVAAIEQLSWRLGAVLVLSAEGMRAVCLQGRRAVLAALQSFLAERLEPVACPRRFRLLPELPLTSQGKLDLRAVRDELSASRRMQAPCLSESRSPTGELSLQLWISPDLAFFAGHFPQAPVVPGVSLIDWAVDLAVARLGLVGHFQGMEVIKFQRMIRPGMTVTLRLRWDVSKGKLYFDYTSAAGAHASGRVLWGG